MIQHPKRDELRKIIIKASLQDKRKYTITEILDDIIKLFENSLKLKQLKNETCQIPNCNRKIYKIGICKKHYPMIGNI